jgi:hypothetical protein
MKKQLTLFGCYKNECIFAANNNYNDMTRNTANNLLLSLSIIILLQKQNGSEACVS